MPRGLHVERLLTPDEALRLRDEWLELHCARPEPLPFQHPDWLVAWWRTLAPDETWMVAVRRGRELVGLAPLVAFRERDERVVGLMGGLVSDFQDVLAAPGEERTVVDAVVAELDHANADRARFDSLPSDSPLLAAPAPDGWTFEATEQDRAPIARLSAVPEKMLEHAAYYRRRVERIGAVHVSRSTAADHATAFGDLVRLHEARWSHRGGGMLSDPRVRRFHDLAGPPLAAAGLARILRLQVNARAVAAYFVFVGARTHRAYLGGFEPEFAHHDVATVLVGEAVREARADGADWFDFLRGTEPYKYRWGAVDRPMLRLEARRR